ncbi:MAG: hypothetical protein EOO61_09115 [Hymenobacter sp.]|nr:MAG: hypothetical protein EOO61_09115 [Hymenobacter sp.]
MELQEIARLVNNDLFLDPPVTADTLQTVQRFTLLWMIYEGRVFGTKYKNATLEELVMAGLIRLENLNTPWNYFASRYMGDSATLNDTFDQLSFESRKDESRLRGILTSGTTDTKERTLAILLVVHRLRNNLFHGIKKMASLNLQRENLDMANSVLEDILMGGPQSKIHVGHTGDCSIWGKQQGSP